MWGPKKTKLDTSGITSEVAVVLLATLSLTILGLGSPVGHATQLVALGEGGIRHTVQHVVGRGGGTP